MIQQSEYSIINSQRKSLYARKNISVGEKLNDKKCFMLSQLFYSLNNIQYIELKYKVVDPESN